MDENKVEKKNEHEKSVYWRYYTDEQREKLRSLKNNDLNGEINILRVLMTRFIKKEAEGYQREAEGTPEEEVKNQSSLRLKGIASLTLGALQKIQVNESAAHPEWEDELAEAYRQAREEMGILDYLSRLEPKEEKEEK